MKVLLMLVLLIASAAFLLAQTNSATCPQDGVAAQATGKMKPNPFAPPAYSCEYSHRFLDKQFQQQTHTFWQACGQ